MSTTKTLGTVLRQFQQIAVENGTAVLRTCVTKLDQIQGTDKYTHSRRLIVADVGALLIEAPTGTGKTLMAGHIAENLSQLHNTSGLPKVIWFWIAPFAGLIDQAIRTIRTEFDTLRPKSPASDREPTDLRSGDVFVTTWSGIAVSDDVSRKTRTATETMPSIDGLITYARTQGFVIGVIIDESHHTFRGENQAVKFYRDVLAPDLTILASATPRDKDVNAFTALAGLNTLRRITVSRQQAVDERLIKQGVKVAVFKAPPDVAGLINFKKTALTQGVAVHKALKKKLSDAGLGVTPLLLVQVDDEDNSVAQATEWLKQMGFRTDGDSALIRSHTAREPDPYLATVAADESVEVLIFKLAVATGFDAPRAFTLVSFRRSRDEDFGVQIVGRILRRDRRLQVEEDLPETLNHGYVFLSDNTAQAGMSNAAQRINSARDELAKVTSNITVIVVGTDDPVAQETKNGQTSFFSDDGRGGIVVTDEENDDNEGGGIPGGQDTSATRDDDNTDPTVTRRTVQEVLSEEWGLTPSPSGNDGQSTSGRSSSNNTGDGGQRGQNTENKLFIHNINAELGAPASFARAVLSVDSADIIRDIVAQFRFDDDAILVAQRTATKILMDMTEIFGNLKDRPEAIRGELAQREIDARAQQTLFRADDFDVIDKRMLHAALAVQLRKEADARHLYDLFDTDEKVRAGLHKILVLRPNELKSAISKAVAKHTKSEMADPIPQSLTSLSRLDPARLNIYGIYPEDLNSWERDFAETLDNVVDGPVLWWHRNPPRKPYSVCIPLPGQPDFYPDFIVGLKDRSRGKGILLVETKRVINDQERNALAKTQAVHPDYQKVMMLYWEESREWNVVEYDPLNDKNILERPFRVELMSNY